MRRQLTDRPIEFALAGGRVRLSAVRDEFDGVVTYMRVLHPERLEQIRFRPGPERFPSYFGDCRREQVISRIGIQVLLARGEIQLPLATDHPQDHLQRHTASHVHACQAKRFGPVPQAAGVIK